MAIINTFPMRVSWENNRYVLTKITGSDLEEIRAYCEKNNLTMVELESRGARYIVHAEKPNQLMKLLRKNVMQIDGWKLISDVPTKKMHWLTYEKQS